MATFHITARTVTHCFHYAALADSSLQAAVDAADLFGDTACGITVRPAGPR